MAKVHTHDDSGEDMIEMGKGAEPMDFVKPEEINHGDQSHLQVGCSITVMARLPAKFTCLHATK